MEGLPSHGLTDRELQCLRGVAEHKRSKTIAVELGLAPKTVDTYIASATRKLGVTDRDTAVRVLLESDPSLWGNSPSPISDVLPAHKVAQARSEGRPFWPFPTAERPTNDLTVNQKLAWIVVLGALMLSAASLYMLGMRMLSERL